MRVLTYNIRLGIESSLHAVANAIRQEAPDLVALQELGDHWVMGAPGDQTAQLAELVGLPHSVHAPALCIAPGGEPWTPESTGLPRRSLSVLTRPGPTVRAPGPEPARFGVGLLSRWPLTDSAVVRLPRREDEQRVLLRATVEAPDGPLSVLVTHLSVHEADRAAQLERLGEELDGLEGPTIVTGDLNDRPDGAILEGLRARGLADSFDQLGGRSGGPTYPARRPVHRIDYILLGGGLWAESLRCPETAASDHRPLVAEVRWG